MVISFKKSRWCKIHDSGIDDLSTPRSGLSRNGLD